MNKAPLTKLLAPVCPDGLKKTRRECRSSINILKVLHQLMDELIETNGSKEELRKKLKETANTRGIELPEEIDQRINEFNG